MALPVKYELKCMLVDLDTQKKIGEFKARVVRDRRATASFEGGNIASGGQSFSVATPDLLQFEPYEQQVVVDGYTYIIVAYQPLTHMRVGRGYSERSRTKELILELE